MNWNIRIPGLVIHIVPLTVEPNFGALAVCDSEIIADDMCDEVALTASEAARRAWDRWGDDVPVLFFMRRRCPNK